jgi:hypothetical protein
VKKQILASILCGILMVSCYPKNDNSYSTDQTRQISPHELLLPTSLPAEIVWTMDFHPLGNYLGNIQCAAIDGTLSVVGNLDIPSKPMVYGFEGISGKLTWTLADIGILEASEYGLFVGNQEAGISLIQPGDGKTIWNTRLANSDYVRAIMYKEDLLFVNTNGYFQYFVIDQNGKIISKYNHLSDFKNDYGHIDFIPDADVFNDADGDVYLRQFGDILYSAAIYDSFTNKLLWKSNSYSISNFLLYKNYVIWLSGDDKLVMANKYDGKVLFESKISPSINFFDDNPDKQHAGYYLCGDDKSDLIYLVLGDSHQLFSINILE